MKRWEPILEVLRMDGVELPDRLPFVDTHDRSTIDRQIGSTVNLHIDGDRLVGKNI